MRRGLAMACIAVPLGALVVHAGERLTVRAFARAPAVEAPIFEVDPFWPKPLPNRWLLGSAVGIAVDANNNIYVLHRAQTNPSSNFSESFHRRNEIGAVQTPSQGECCVPAPHVLVFAADGSLVRHWGGPGEGYDWPASNHRLAIDRAGNVWIGGTGDGDTHILKFAADGKFIAQLGKTPAAGTASVRNSFRGVAKVATDDAANEAYVADPGNRRVAAIDIATGALKREWGAYGEAPDTAALPPYDPAAPPARQFRNVYCAMPSNDGLVYVCDREANRIQVFRKNGTYVKEKVIAPRTRGEGAVWDIAFSRDPQQRFLYVADGSNMKVHILDRQSLDVLTAFGSGGRQPGQFFGVHSLATDAQGNLYTTETYEGKRVQKFLFKGVGPVTAANQGVLWPRRR
jgi:DNA-binding beta-propeller fold protein YncE